MQSSSRMSTTWTVAPRSLAIINQGVKLASWSRRVRTISSPGARRWARERESAKASEVMFWPKTISAPPLALSRSAIASWASATMASLSWLVTKTPSWLALQRER